MYKFKEYKFNSNCPYCGCSFALIIDDMSHKKHRCVECGRILTIFFKPLVGIVEVGTHNQIVSDLVPLYKECCNA